MSILTRGGRLRPIPRERSWTDGGEMWVAGEVFPHDMSKNHRAGLMIDQKITTIKTGLTRHHCECSECGRKTDIYFRQQH